MAIIATSLIRSRPSSFAALRAARTQSAPAENVLTPPTQRYPSVDPAAKPGQVGYSEVPEELRLARLAVCESHWEYPCVGIDRRPQSTDSAEMKGLRGKARELDRRLARKAQVDNVEAGAEAGLVADPGAHPTFAPGDDETAATEPDGLRVEPGLAEWVDACTQEESLWHELLAEWGAAQDEIDGALDAACAEHHGAFAAGVLARLAESAAHRATEAEVDAIDAQGREERDALRALIPGAEAVPDGYTLTREGLFFQPDPTQPSRRLALTPVLPSRLMRTAEGTGWSVCLEAVSYDGQPVARWFPMTDCYAHLGKVVAELAQHGVFVEDERHFRTFLIRCLDNRNALPRQRGSLTMGFVTAPTQDGRAKVCYVLPNETLYPTGVTFVEDVVLFDSVKTAVYRAYHARGSFEDWRGVAERTRGNRLYTFALSLAFGAPLLSPSHTENGGIHCYAKTSLGKTLIQQLAATVFGCGAAPLFGGATSLVLSGHGAQSAIEALVAASNGPLVIIDGLGNPPGPLSLVGPTGRIGRGRSQGDGGLQAGQTGSALSLSTGEEPIAPPIQPRGRRPMAGGEAARFIEVPVYGLLSSGNPAEVEALKRDCGRYYGTAGVRFLQSVLDRFAGDPVDLQVTISAEVDRLVEQLCVEAREQGFVLDTRHPRAMRRLALAALGGLWAIEAGILPHTEEEVMAAVRAVRDAWLGAQPFVSEAKGALDAIRDYVLRHRGQMIETGQGARPLPSNRHRIVHQGKVILSDDAFREACAGLDPTLVLACLKDAGLLHQDDDQSKAHTKIAELGLRGARMVHVWLEPLLAEPESASTGDDEDVPSDEDDDSGEAFGDDDLADR